MIEWLKFFFLGFFSNKLTKEAATRKLTNTVLGFASAFVIVCCGLITGYVASFGHHYGNSTAFKEFVYSAFADDKNDELIGVDIVDGKLHAKISHSRDHVNTVINTDSTYAKNGYDLILDTRNSSETFVDFTVNCTASDKKISYDEYLRLPSEQKSGYSLSVEYSGQAVDIAAKHEIYISFLNDISDEESARFDADAAAELANIKSQYASNEINEDEYFIRVYALYVEAYYAGIDLSDAYGLAPTLKTYYLNYSTNVDTHNYLIVLDDVCACSFTTDSGILMEFGGNYEKLSSKIISSKEMPAENMRDNIDELIACVFKSGNVTDFMVYIISAGRLAILYFVGILLVALIAFLFVRVLKCELCAIYTEMLKMVCSFLFISSIITFLSTMLLSLFISRGVVFILSGIVLVVVLILRTLLLTVPEIIKDRRVRMSNAEDQVDEINNA